jgi:hypothetical protein
MVGNFAGSVVGSIAYSNASFCCCFQVYIVETHPTANDDATTFKLVHVVGVDGCDMPDQETKIFSELFSRNLFFPPEEIKLQMVGSNLSLWDTSIGVLNVWAQYSKRTHDSSVILELG